jgi:hypothetical protein
MRENWSKSAKPVYLRVGQHPDEAKSRSSMLTAWLVYVVAIAALTWFYVFLLDSYPKLNWFVVPAFLFAIIAPLSWLVWKYGRDTVQLAADLIPKIWKAGGSSKDRKV